MALWPLVQKTRLSQTPAGPTEEDQREVLHAVVARAVFVGPDEERVVERGSLPLWRPLESTREAGNVFGHPVADAGHRPSDRNVAAIGRVLMRELLVVVLV